MMKKLDSDTLTIWLCLGLFGLGTSFGLSKWFGIPILYSVWVTVPGSLAAGILGMRCWMKSIDARIAKATTPLQTRQVEGLGEMKQLPDYWTIEIPVPDKNAKTKELHVTIDADGNGPSERQINLLRTLKEKHSTLWPMLLERLREFSDPKEGFNVLEALDMSHTSYEIKQDGSEQDIEVIFSEKELSDMQYVICLKDWLVVDMYAGD